MCLPAYDRKSQFTQLGMCFIDLSNASDQASMELHVPEHFRRLVLLTIDKAKDLGFRFLSDPRSRLVVFCPLSSHTSEGFKSDSVLGVRMMWSLEALVFLISHLVY